MQIRVEEEYHTDFAKLIKELEKQNRMYETMANSGALDRGYANEARQVIQEKISIAKQKRRIMRKLKKQQLAQTMPTEKV